MICITRVLFWKLPSKQSFPEAWAVGPTVITLSPLSFLIIPWWMASKFFEFLKHLCGSVPWFLGPLTRIVFGNADLGISSLSRWKMSSNITCLLYNLFVICDKMKPLHQWIRRGMQWGSPGRVWTIQPSCHTVCGFWFWKILFPHSAVKVLLSQKHS